MDGSKRKDLDSSLLTCKKVEHMSDFKCTTAIKTLHTHLKINFCTRALSPSCRTLLFFLLKAQFLLFQFLCLITKVAVHGNRCWVPSSRTLPITSVIRNKKINKLGVWLNSPKKFPFFLTCFHTLLSLTLERLRRDGNNIVKDSGKDSCNALRGRPNLH